MHTLQKILGYVNGARNFATFLGRVYNDATGIGLDPVAINYLTTRPDATEYEQQAQLGRVAPGRVAVN